MSFTETVPPTELPSQHPDILDSLMPVFLEGSEMLGESEWLLLDGPEQPTKASCKNKLNNQGCVCGLIA